MSVDSDRENNCTNFVVNAISIRLKFEMESFVKLVDIERVCDTIIDAMNGRYFRAEV